MNFLCEVFGCSFRKGTSSLWSNSWLISQVLCKQRYTMALWWPFLIRILYKLLVHCQLFGEVIIKELFSIRSEFSFFFHSVMPKQLESESEVTQLCPTLCDPMDCSLSGSSIHGIFQARILEWVAISFSRGSSQPSDRTWVSHTVARSFTIWATSSLLKCKRSTINLFVNIFMLISYNKGTNHCSKNICCHEKGMSFFSLYFS